MATLNKDYISQHALKLGVPHMTTFWSWDMSDSDVRNLREMTLKGEQGMLFIPSNLTLRRWGHTLEWDKAES